jgi:hypothetical protein
MLQEMFGEEAVPKMLKGDKLPVTVNNATAVVDLATLVCTYSNRDMCPPTAFGLYFYSKTAIRLTLSIRYSILSYMI